METDKPGWEFETRDETSALLEKLRGLERHTRDDGEWVKASDVDAVVNAAIESPKD